MEIPYFLKLDGESLLFNLDDSEFEFYIPEVFFNNTSKNCIAFEEGQYISTIGICSWAIIDKNGKRGEVKLFNFPTMFMTKPYENIKVKGLKLGPNFDEDDYRVLKYRKGDEVISQIRVPQEVSNAELFFKLATLTAKIPNTISYKDGWKLFIENAKLNGFNYNLSSQIFGMIWAAVCRDPNNITQPFRLSDTKNMNGYKVVSIKLISEFVSPFTAITSEGFDEGIQSAVLMSKDKVLTKSPLEKVLTQ